MIAGMIGRLKRAGMTLIECLVAVFVIVAFVSGACAVLLQAKHVNDVARLHYTAINIAKDRLERANTVDFTTIPMLAKTNEVLNLKGAADDNGDFRRTTEVVTVRTNLTQISVYVEVRNRITRDFDGRSRAQVMSTYRAQYLEPPE